MVPAKSGISRVAGDESLLIRGSCRRDRSLNLLENPHGTEKRRLPELQQGNTASRAVSVHLLFCDVLYKVRRVTVRHLLSQMWSIRTHGPGPVQVGRTGIKRSRSARGRPHGTARSDQVADPAYGLTMIPVPCRSDSGTTNTPRSVQNSRTACLTPLNLALL